MSNLYAQGRYRAVVANQGFAEAKSTGNTQFVLTFDLLGMLDPSQPDTLLRVAPAQRSTFRSITEATIDYFLEDLKYLGYDKPSFGPLDPSHAQFHDLKGTEIDVVCSHEDRDGKTKEKWSLSKGGGMNLKPVDNTALRKLDALFGSKLKANAAPTNKAAPARQTANAASDTVPWDDNDPRF